MLEDRLVVDADVVPREFYPPTFAFGVRWNPSRR
jgi:hypothetical protein